MVQNMTMTCPPGWRDTSMLILRAEAAGASGIAANLVVTRDVLPPDLPTAPAERMTALIDRQVAEMKPRLAGFAEVSRQVSGTVPPLVGEIRIDWTSGQSDLRQGLTLVDNGDGNLLIATATAARGEYPAHEPQFAAMLQTFKLV